jgi:hypothetical protein
VRYQLTPHYWSVKVYKGVFREMKKCFRASCVDEMSGNNDLEHTYYCYSFTDVGNVGSAKKKRRNVKIIYSQDGVSLSHEVKGKTRLVMTRSVFLGKQVDRN